MQPSLCGEEERRNTVICVEITLKQEKEKKNDYRFTDAERHI